jgi:DNA sulfur modification protein DndB
LWKRRGKHTVCLHANKQPLPGKRTSASPAPLTPKLPETAGNAMAETFEYVFAAIRGTQAGREYYVSMCPLKLLPKLFLFDEEELAPEFRAQRTLNRKRIPEMANYVLDNRGDYAFSAITASIDGEARFLPAGNSGTERLGSLHVAMTARFVINDGQHRRAAIERAVQEQPSLGDETIAVVFYLDQGLERSQQLFADLNRYAIRPTRSLSLLYDYRDDEAQVVRQFVLESELFRDLVEMEKSTLSARSRKLFTLSALYNATTSLLNGLAVLEYQESARVIKDFWEAVSGHMPEWQMVRDRSMSAAEVRRDFIHSHGIVLQAVGRAGNALLSDHKEAEWRDRLRGLRNVDWARSNAKLWEGRALIGGRVSKSGNNVTLTTNVVKNALGIGLSPEEQRVENAYLRGDLDKEAS